MVILVALALLYHAPNELPKKKVDDAALIPESKNPLQE